MGREEGRQLWCASLNPLSSGSLSCRIMFEHSLFPCEIKDVTMPFKKKMLSVFVGGDSLLCRSLFGSCWNSILVWTVVLRDRLTSIEDQEDVHKWCDIFKKNVWPSPPPFVTNYHKPYALPCHRSPCVSKTYNNNNKKT